MTTVLSSEHHGRHLNFIRAHPVHEAQHHCFSATGKFYPLQANKGLNCQKMINVLVKVSWVSHWAVKRPLYNCCGRESKFGRKSERLAQFSIVTDAPFFLASVTGMECFTDTAMGLPLCPSNTDVPTKHWHSTKWAFSFSYCKEQTGFTRLKLEPVSPFPSPLYCTGQKWF